MAKLLVGVTGSFGSGKSTVLKEFKKLGVRTLDCDQIVRQAWGRKSPLYPKLKNLAKKEGILGPRGGLSKAQVAKRAFQDLSFRRKLEGLLHPWVFGKITLAKGREKGILVAEIPLLFETGFNRKTDFVITVKASPTQSLARLKKLGHTSKEWKARIKAQWPLSKKVRQSDAVVLNDGPPRQTTRQVKKILQEIKSL